MSNIQKMMKSILPVNAGPRYPVRGVKVDTRDDPPDLNLVLARFYEM